MKFSEKLRAKREEHRLSQEEIAKELGISRRTVINYEQGVSYPNDRAIYFKLAKILKTDRFYFLTEDEEFLTEATKRYGRKGFLEAQNILAQTSALFAGGELSAEDKLAFAQEMQAIFFDATERAKTKFTPKKHRKPKETQDD